MSENYFGGSDPQREEEEYGDYIRMTQHNQDQLTEQVQVENLDEDVVEELNQ
jgi:hypothetical protein